jgi:rhodanese-related sulfurtransferase
MSKFLSIIPKPDVIQNESGVGSLNTRLNWGEPALTIIDVRNRDAFNKGHIMGAIAMPIQELVGRAQASLELNRDIYVYGDNAKETADAAKQLRQAGYQHIAELVGGLPAWRAARYPVEGI